MKPGAICEKCGCMRGWYGGWWRHPDGMCERFGGCSHSCDHKCRHKVKAGEDT